MAAFNNLDRPYRVLIMCQRKKSNTVNKKNVSNTVRNLQENIRETLSLDGITNVTFEYLGRFTKKSKLNTPYSNNNYNHPFFFTPNMPSNKNYSNMSNYEKTRNFIEENRGSYDMIIFNTCPLSEIFKYMPQLNLILKPYGVLLIRSYERSNPSGVVFKLYNNRNGEIFAHYAKFLKRTSSNRTPKNRNPNPEYKTAFLNSGFMAAIDQEIETYKGKFPPYLQNIINNRLYATFRNFLYVKLFDTESDTNIILE